MSPAKLRAALSVVKRLAQAAAAGAPVDQLDNLAGRAIQHLGAFRNSIRVSLVHRRSVLAEMGYDGSACLDTGGELTEDAARVTCPKCKSHNDSGNSV